MIQVNLDKAKEIAHTKRREVREKLFEPLDVKSTIPMYAQEAEAERQRIRDEFADIQQQIGIATTADELIKVIARCKALA